MIEFNHILICTRTVFIQLVTRARSSLKSLIFSVPTLQFVCLSDNVMQCSDLSSTIAKGLASCAVNTISTWLTIVKVLHKLLQFYIAISPQL